MMAGPLIIAMGSQNAKTRSVLKSIFFLLPTFIVSIEDKSFERLFIVSCLRQVELQISVVYTGREI